MRDEHRKGLLAATIGILILTPDTLLIRLIDIDAWTMSGLRGLLTAVSLIAYFTWTDRGLPWRRFVGLGGKGLLASLFFAGNSLLFVYSVEHTHVANTLVLISATPLVAALASAVFLRETIALRTWIAIGVVFAAMLLLFGGSLGSGRLTGDLAAIGTACLLAGTFVLARSAGRFNMVPCVAMGGLIVAILTAPFADPLALGARQWSFMLLLGLVILPLSFGLLVLAPRWAPAAEVSLIMLLEALLGPFWVWLVLAEVPDPATLIGGSIILVTLLIHGIAARRAW